MGPEVVVVSNSYPQSLDEGARAEFQEIEPIEGKYFGSIKAWKLSVQSNM